MMFSRWMILAAPDSESLRRSLSRQDSVRTLKAHEGTKNEDLSGYSRAELENLVQTLRQKDRANAEKDIEERAAIRDMLSHSSTGKDANDHLHLNANSDATAEDAPPSFEEIMDKAKKRAFRGGLAGMGAGVIQVMSLMWLRTTMNYQYRHGTTTTFALKHLYKEGGIPRFYQGVVPALFQAPLSRFGDTAANAGAIALLDSYPQTKDLPSPVKSIFSSSAAATWRIFLMPIDTVKTIMQVEGTKGLPMLMQKFKTGGPSVFYQGAGGAVAATFAGHYPWFATFNFLQANVPQQDDFAMKLVRNAGIGFASSFTSDIVSNSLRVIKTTKQTYHEPITYREAVGIIVEKDGVIGLFTRGLGTRVMANGFQGILFTVLWKYFEEQLNKND